ncbi:MAG: MFS transporter [Acidimicrobiales bacterium]|nr:MAG: MFS transporter [Acidimicrobiales bacterium]
MVNETATTASPWRIYGLIGGAIALSTLNFSLVFVAFGEIEETFDVSKETVSWALTAFSITTAAVFVPAGWAADRFGRARMFLTGFGLFIVGSALVSVSPTVEFLIFARMVQAAGLAIESPASLALVLDAFPPERRSTAVGAMGAVGGVAVAIGPAVGGALIDNLTWRWAFFINVPLGILVFALVAPRLPRDDVGRGPKRQPPDLVGVALLMLGIAALAMGIVQSDDWGYTDRRTVAAITIALVVLPILIARSARHAEPILYLPLFGDHDFRVGSSLSFLVAGTFAGTFLAMVQLMSQSWGLSLMWSGLAVGMIPAIAGPMSVVAGRLADRYGHRAVILPGSLLLAGSAIWMYTQVTEERQLLAVWVPFVVLYGFGVGCAHAATQAAALNNVTGDRLGIGGSMNRISQEIGQTLCAAIVIAMLARYGVVDGVKASMILLLVMSLLAAPLAAQLRHRGQPA